MDFQENVFRKVREIHLFGPGSAGARKVCFEDLNKGVFLKSKTKHVVKYDVSLDILLMGSVYVIKSTFLRGNPISDQIIPA